jgi:uncharacterized protein
MYYLVYQEARSHLFRWRLYAEPDRKVAESIETYYNRADCLAAIEFIKNSAAFPVKEGEAY